MRAQCDAKPERCMKQFYGCSHDLGVRASIGFRASSRTVAHRHGAHDRDPSHRRRPPPRAAGSARLLTFVGSGGGFRLCVLYAAIDAHVQVSVLVCMLLCVNLCMCRYICLGVHMRTHVSMYVCVCRPMPWRSASMCLYVCAQVRVCVCVCVCAYVNACIGLSICMCWYSVFCVFECVCVYAVHALIFVCVSIRG